MKICDRCEGRPIALPLKDMKDHIHYDLCHKCQEDFYRFMQGYECIDVTPKEEKRGPGRPKKNGTN